MSQKAILCSFHQESGSMQPVSQQNHELTTEKKQVLNFCFDIQKQNYTKHQAI